MSLQEAQKERSKIIGIIEKTVYTALSDITKTEPHWVANLVFYLSDMVNNRLRKMFNDYGIQVKSGGIFVHQQPQVKCNNFPKKSPNAVEIGDLLLIVTHKLSNGTLSRNALLLQVKRMRDWPPKTDNPNQHHLYAYWPEFEYVRSTPALNGHKRLVTGPHLYNGAKYLLIGGGIQELNLLRKMFDCQLCCCFIEYSESSECNAVTAYPSKPHLSGFNYLTCELYNLLFGNAGRSFIYQPSNNNINWDQVITDLIDVTSHRISSYTKGPRGKGDLSCFLVGDISSVLVGSRIETDLNESVERGDTPPQITESSEEDIESENRGISIVEIYIDETK